MKTAADLEKAFGAYGSDGLTRHIREQLTKMQERLIAEGVDPHAFSAALHSETLLFAWALKVPLAHVLQGTVMSHGLVSPLVEMADAAINRGGDA